MTPTQIFEKTVEVPGVQVQEDIMKMPQVQMVEKIVEASQERTVEVPQAPVVEEAGERFGRFQDAEDGQTVCKQCSPGRFESEVSKSACVDCESGRFRNEGAGTRASPGPGYRYE